jgi:hypothetical protein
MERVMAAALGASFFLFGSVWALAQDQFRPIRPAAQGIRGLRLCGLGRKLL